MIYFHAIDFSEGTHVNPIHVGRSKKPCTSFSLVTSTNIKISLETFLTFSFNPFAIVV